MAQKQIRRAHGMRQWKSRLNRVEEHRNDRGSGESKRAENDNGTGSKLGITARRVKIEAERANW